MSLSIMQWHKVCYTCWTKYRIVTKDSLEEHHILGGALRGFSERYGLKVWLCHNHHNEPPDGVHYNAAASNELKKQAQAAFEARYGHERWMQEVGKDYLSC